MSDRRAPTPLFRRTLAACALLLLAATGATMVRAAEVQWYVEILAAAPGRRIEVCEKCEKYYSTKPAARRRCPFARARARTRARVPRCARRRRRIAAAE